MLKIQYEDVKTAIRKVERKIYDISAYVSGYSKLVKREKIVEKPALEYVQRFNETN